MVGDMTISVMNRASPMVTWGGGRFWVPRAWRTRARTTTMRTKQVVMRMIDGARASTVRRIITLMTVERPRGWESEVMEDWPGRALAASAMRESGLVESVSLAVGAAIVRSEEHTYE